MKSSSATYKENPKASLDQSFEKLIKCNLNSLENIYKKDAVKNHYKEDVFKDNNSISKSLEINGEKITQCEIKILNLLIRGKTAKEIGNALYLSNRTVETYLDRIKNKLNVTTKSQLIDLVFDHIMIR